MLFYKTKKYVKALSNYKKALALEKDGENYAAKVHYSIGLSYVSQDSDREAVKSFKEALKLNAEFTKAQDELTRAEERISKGVVDVKETDTAKKK